MPGAEILMGRHDAPVHGHEGYPSDGDCMACRAEESPKTYTPQPEKPDEIDALVKWEDSEIWPPEGERLEQYRERVAAKLAYLPAPGEQDLDSFNSCLVAAAPRSSYAIYAAVEKVIRKRWPDPLKYPAELFGISYELTNAVLAVINDDPSS